MGLLKMQGVVGVSMLKIVAGDRLAGDVCMESWSGAERGQAIARIWGWRGVLKHGRRVKQLA